MTDEAVYDRADSIIEKFDHSDIRGHLDEFISDNFATIERLWYSSEVCALVGEDKALEMWERDSGEVDIWLTAELIARKEPWQLFFDWVLPRVIDEVEESQHDRAISAYEEGL